MFQVEDQFVQYTSRRQVRSSLTIILSPVIVTSALVLIKIPSLLTLCSKFFNIFIFPDVVGSISGRICLLNSNLKLILCCIIV